MLNFLLVAYPVLYVAGVCSITVSLDAFLNLCLLCVLIALHFSAFIYIDTKLDPDFKARLRQDIQTLARSKARVQQSSCFSILSQSGLISSMWRRAVIVALSAFSNNPTTTLAEWPFYSGFYHGYPWAAYIIGLAYSTSDFWWATAQHSVMRAFWRSFWRMDDAIIATEKRVNAFKRRLRHAVVARLLQLKIAIKNRLAETRDHLCHRCISIKDATIHWVYRTATAIRQNPRRVAASICGIALIWLVCRYAPWTVTSTHDNRWRITVNCGRIKGTFDWELPSITIST
jgi:hypothetical protein